MTRIITFLITIVLSITVSAQEKNEQEKIKKVIGTFFEGLHKGDTILIKSVLHKNIKTQTTFSNKNGKNKLETTNKTKLLNNKQNKNPEQKYFEKLLSFDIKVDGNLASVWTPYEFYVNDNFSHCGANSFQLFNNNGTWEIIYLVDMRRRDTCKVLKDKN
jgi:hypothetical protein